MSDRSSTEGRTAPRLERRFEQVRAQSRAALIPFFTAGFPGHDLTVPVMHALVEGGADIIELGVPFSDPMADGPVIQKASERALAQKMTLARVLDDVARFRERDRDTPVVLMGYCNPVERMGMERFCTRAAQAGVDGVLLVDSPPEESQDYARQMTRAGLAPIFLVAPTSTAERIEQVAALARGYVYFVSLTGVTGAAHIDTASISGLVRDLQARTGLPVGVGFGIRDASTVAAVAGFADAVVIGSRIIQVLDEGPPEEAPARIREWTKGIAPALKRESKAA